MDTIPLGMPFGMPLGCLWDAFAMSLGCLWHAFGMLLECFWDGPTIHFKMGIHRRRDFGMWVGTVNEVVDKRNLCKKCGFEIAKKKSGSCQHLVIGSGELPNIPPKLFLKGVVVESVFWSNPMS